jgi:hypothetical protein
VGVLRVDTVGDGVFVHGRYGGQNNNNNNNKHQQQQFLLLSPVVRKSSSKGVGENEAAFWGLMGSGLFYSTVL